MATYDGLAVKQRDHLATGVKYYAFTTQTEIMDFVTHHRGGEALGMVGWYPGSFNYCFGARFDDERPDAIICFARPGRTAFAQEKIAYEARAVEFLCKSPRSPSGDSYTGG